MKKYFPFLLIILLAISACSEDIGQEADKDNTDTISVAKPAISKDTVYKTVDPVEDQVAQLKRIIEINKSQLKEYQTKIAEGDTLDLKGLPLYVEDLKKAIKLKEERLEKLKRK